MVTKIHGIEFEFVLNEYRSAKFSIAFKDRTWIARLNSNPLMHSKRCRSAPSALASLGLAMVGGCESGAIRITSR